MCVRERERLETYRVVKNKAVPNCVFDVKKKLKCSCPGTFEWLLKEVAICILLLRNLHLHLIVNIISPGGRYANKYSLPKTDIPPH